MRNMASSRCHAVQAAHMIIRMGDGDSIPRYPIILRIQLQHDSRCIGIPLERFDRPVHITVLIVQAGVTAQTLPAQRFIFARS